MMTHSATLQGLPHQMRRERTVSMTLLINTRPRHVSLLTYVGHRRNVRTVMHIATSIDAHTDLDSLSF